MLAPAGPKRPKKRPGRAPPPEDTGVMRIMNTVLRTALLAAGAVLCLAIGAAGLFIGLTSPGPALQPWHTEALTAEFTAANESECRSLDDYMRLEDRLFQQLQTTVYQAVAVGPAAALVRYSAGSAADPTSRTPNWNRSFELPAERPVGGVLLLHGMSDGPYSLRALGETLSRRGYHVVGLRLPGHGTAPSGLRTATWEDMAAAVRIGARHLAAKIGAAPLHVIGYSNGAPLALAYTLDARHGRDLPVPASLVLISPAIAITPAAALARWKDRLARLPGLEALAWTQILPEFDPFRYNSFASNAGYQVHRLTRAVSRRIAADAAAAALDGFPPTLVFLSAVDATVSTESVINHLLIHLPPPRNELVLFDVNRRDVHSTVMVADPGPLTARLLASPGLPFALTLLANERPDSSAVVIRHKAALSAALSDDHLRLSWPAGVISLSHIALPFPPDDPLYGRQRPAQGSGVFLGQIAVQGERGLLLFPADWLLRLRHNPFYEFLEMRTLQWLEAASPSAASAGR